MDIAVVGRGCVLPGAHSPAELWELICRGDTVSRGRRPTVTAFEESYDPEGLRVDLSDVAPHIRWIVHAARTALLEARVDDTGRTGLILGHLSLPSSALLAFGRSPSTGNARDRFHTGTAALLPAEALGLGGRCFTVDAACAAALYSVKFACDELATGAAEVMLAGGCNGSDPAFLGQFFGRVEALSPQQLSRPFHREADGLVPSEGVALVALTRLTDARMKGQRVLGVIRGVGLSNDGRGKGLVSPDPRGQVRAMRQAYSRAGVESATVSLLECHATGTAVGDAVETASIAEVFAESSDLPIGSVKANLGHTLNAAGAVGLLKVLGAIEAGIRPPTPVSGDVLDAVSGQSTVRVVRALESWPAPRRAAVSAFGFGGCNAHIVLDEDDPDRIVQDPGSIAAARVAIVAVATNSGRPLIDVGVELRGLRFPPNDMRRCLPQGVLALQTAREAAARTVLPHETMVVLGLGCDPRMASLLDVPDGGPEVTLGVMPNMVAGRISSQLDLWGPSIVVSQEEASGHIALDLAVRAVANGEVGAAIAGAVDLSCDPIHEAALAALGRDIQTADAAAFVILKTVDSARRDGDRVLAVIAGAAEPTGHIVRAGSASHAAQGLLEVAEAVGRLDRGEYERITVVTEPITAPSCSVTVVRAEMDIGVRQPLSEFEPPITEKRIMNIPAHPAVFDRAQLEHLATGRISEVFGPAFAAQDGFARQTKMPAPPMLLVDRVTRLDAEPATMGLGAVWSQTDVGPDSWYLDADQRVPACLMVEAGQASALLASWLGVDLRHQGDRVYRLLGGEIEFHGPTAAVGDTITYEIHADKHAVFGDMRLFLFHFRASVAGEPRVSFWSAQAGFFTEEQLAGSQGLRWDPSQLRPPTAAPDSPQAKTELRAFGSDQVRAFAEGREADCFGPSWPVRQDGPRITRPEHLLFGSVPEFDPEGGPHGSGYLRARLDIAPESWFFDGHFAGDPCMPATVICQGSLQAMAFYLAALGYTIDRPGTRFEVATGHRFPMVCRGQVTPSTRALDYELFITGCRGGAEPELECDVLCSSDGLRSFHVQGLRLRIVRD